ncbi:MAG: sigma-70 family RNA polymerase sigma factor [Phycisphaerae bacterium]|nr:sigma-70 family RNA polymerase sigma factor [Phycisphaerae bacterium]
MKKKESTMCSATLKNPKMTNMLNDNMPIARQIASRLKRRYTWVSMEDLYSYSLLGLTMSANAFDPARGVPFPNFASQKGMFWAIDQMRKDGVLRRRSSASMPRVLPFSEASGLVDHDETWTPDVQDRHAEKEHRQLEARDLCTALLRQLRNQDRQLLIMYYSKHMTFREIAKVFEISESSVCLRHKALIRRLRRLAMVMRVA